MMRLDIHRCKPTFKRRWITKNRKRQTLIKSLVVTLCLGMAICTAFYLFAAGAKSTNAESANLLIPENGARPSAVVTASTADAGMPATLSGDDGPVLSAAPKPALMSEKKTQVRLSLTGAAMPLQTQLLGEYKSAPKAAKNEARRPQTKAAPAIKDPVVKVVKVQPQKVEPTDAAASTIPSFENTSGGADEKKVEVASARDAEAPVWSTLLSVVVKLVLVVALAYVSILGLKWFMSNKERPTSNGSGLKVVDSVSLGANRSLHVVDCAGKRLILASTPNQVNLISETEAAMVPEQSTGQTFDAYLDGYVASQSEVDTAAVRVGQALRNGAAFLQKKAADYRSHKASGDSKRNV